MRDNNFIRFVFILLISLLFSVFVWSDSAVNVGSGSANLTVQVFDLSIPLELEDVYVILLNASIGDSQNSTYYFDSQNYTLITDAFGNVTFYNLSIVDNYSVLVFKRGYFVNISGSINLSDDGETGKNDSLIAYISPDTTPPQIEVISLSIANESVFQSESEELIISFEVYDNLQYYGFLEDDEINVSLYIATLDSGFMYNTSLNFTNGIGELSANFSEEGNYSWYLNATDYSGNWNTSEIFTFFIDNSPPDVTIVSSSKTHAKEGDILNVVVEVEDNYHAIEDFFVFAQLNYSGSTLADFVHTSGNTWEGNITIAYPGDGEFAINVSAVDLAGNVGWNSSQNVIIDNVAPQIIITKPLQFSLINATEEINHTANVTINYTLSEPPNSTYYYYVGHNYSLPLDLTHEFNLSLMYPGKHRLTIYANDSAGNLGYNTTTFYGNFLFNATRWLDNFMANNPEIIYSNFYNIISFEEDIYENLTSDLVNITDEEFDIFILFDDNNEKIHFFAFDLYESELGYNFSIELSDSDFVNQFEFYYGEEVVDLIKLNYFNKLADIEWGGFEMSLNISDFDNALVCDGDYLDCTMVAICQGNGDHLCVNYDEEFSDDPVDFNINNYNFAHDITYFILTNNTLPPRIEVTNPANETTFPSPAGNSITLRVNKESMCTYRISNGTIVSEGQISSSLIQPHADFIFNLPNPPFLIGTYNLEVTCVDDNENTGIYNFVYSLDDTELPVITSISPSQGTTYPSSTTYVTMTLVTSEPAICRYKTSAFGSEFDGTQMSSSNYFTHTASIPAEPGNSFEFHFQCMDFNGFKSIGRSTFFSVSSVSTDSGGLIGGSDAPSAPSQPPVSDFISDSFKHSFIGSGQEVILTPTKAGMPISRFTFSIDRDINNITMILESFSERSRFSVSAPGLSNVYRYLQIKNDRSIPISDFNNFMIEIKVPVSWMSQHSLSHNDVIIGRFDGQRNEWEVLDKTFLREANGNNYYSIVSEPAVLFAISRQDVVAPGQVIGQDDDSQGTVIDSVDTDESDTLIVQDSRRAEFSFEDIPIIFVIVVSGIFLSAVVYANKGTMAKISKAKKKKKVISKIEKEKAEKIRLNGNALDLRTLETMQYSEKELFEKKGKLREIAIPLQELETPNPAVLKNYLITVFKNIWIKGYNDDDIKKYLKQKGLPDDEISSVFEYIKADITNKEYSQVTEEVQESLNYVRSEINQKYGFSEKELVDMLKSNGWPTYMVEIVIKDLKSKIKIPFEFSLKDSLKEDEAVSNTPLSSESPLENYIYDARVAGLSRDEIQNNLVNAGWSSDEVLSRVSKIFLK